jgi:hypothetical protein
MHKDENPSVPDHELDFPHRMIKMEAEFQRDRAREVCDGAARTRDHSRDVIRRTGVLVSQLKAPRRK